jgi:hypothetical protein
VATPPDDMNDDGLESGSAFKPAIRINVEIAMRGIGSWGSKKVRGLESLFVRSIVSERLCTLSIRQGLPAEGCLRLQLGSKVGRIFQLTYTCPN